MARKANRSADAPETTPVAVVPATAAGLGPARPDWVAREEPLEIRVRGRSVVVTMRTPGHDAELAAGSGDIAAPRVGGEGRPWGRAAAC